MPSVNFLYRSKKDHSFLNLRLLYRYEGADHVIGGKSRIWISKKYWEKEHRKGRTRDVELKNKQIEINKKLNDLSRHILESFHETSPVTINKDWLSQTIEEYYDPDNNDELPRTLVEYIDTYIRIKGNELTNNSIKKFGVIKNKLVRFQEYRKRTIYLKDVDLSFKSEFEKYSLAENYSYNTVTRDIRFIKTFCNHAKDYGLEVSSQLSKIKTKYISVDHIYLTEEDISKIENFTGLNSHLNNAREWLLISCYTGQRVSDFMRYKSSMIREENGKFLLEFTQKKTNKKMTIPMSKKVLEILEANNNEFPKPISDQKYNKYIKEVARLSGVREKVKGSKKVKIKSNGSQYRKEEGIYEKWELVTSHIGRRSFATNYYGKIPTSFLIYVTGHSTETMFLNYIGKSNKDIAIEMANYF